MLDAQVSDALRIGARQVELVDGSTHYVNYLTGVQDHAIMLSDGSLCSTEVIKRCFDVASDPPQEFIPDRWRPWRNSIVPDSVAPDKGETW